MTVLTVPSVRDDLAAFARVRAELELESGRAELFRQLGLGEDQWLEIETTWLERLTDETERGSLELAGRYVLAYRARKAELTEQEDAPQEATGAAAVAATGPASTGESSLDETGALDLRRVGLAPLPFQEPAPGQAPSGPPACPPSENERRAMAGYTGMMPVVAPGEIVPFRSGRDPGVQAAPAPVALRSGVRALDPSSVDETQGVDLRQIWGTGSAVPFKSPEAEGGALPRAGLEVATPAPSTVQDSGAVASRSVNETQGVDLRAIRGAGDAVPFKGSQSAPPPSTAPSLPALPDGDLDRTAPTGIALCVVGPALPFEQGGHGRLEPPPVDLTVEQYASLCAMCAVYPEPAHQTQLNTRFGVGGQIQGERARDRLDQHWQRRFEREPALLETWRVRLQEYRGWFAAELAGRVRR